MSANNEDLKKVTQRRRPHGPGARMMPGEKAKDFKGTLRQLLADAAGTQRVLPYPDEALTAQNIQEGDTIALLPDGTLKKLRCI